ncbi:VOC family protein [Cognaticolwellia mytili]|uniref:VOC family protein n=1 Tax=Cognaticolwellia mytili TaxID=1888913 RepID=UPI000A177EC8|nr:VOC family protein [Cognaticolwellia mytili]
MNIKKTLLLAFNFISICGIFSMPAQADVHKISLMGTIYMVTLHTDNYQKMKEFYKNKLEMSIVNEVGEFIEFRTKGMRLSISSKSNLNSFIPTKSLQDKRSGSGVGVGFKYKSSKDVDLTYEKLLKLGVKFVAKPARQPWGEYTAFFSDPDGNVHELVSDN